MVERRPARPPRVAPHGGHAPADAPAEAAQLLALNQHLQRAREDERASLARDLHDELGALLTSAKLDAARLSQRLQGAGPEVLARLGSLTQSLEQIAALKRKLTEGLHPSSLADLGLMVTLETLARTQGERLGGVVHVALRPVRLSASAGLVAYRMVQEAFTNIGQHAQATQVWLSMETVGGEVQVSVRDDGKGFEPASVGAEHHGLEGMRYRVQAEGGRLKVQSAPGRGCMLTLCLPALEV